MNHVIAIRAGESIPSSAMLFQVAAVLRMSEVSPRWIEVLSDDSGTAPRFRVGLRDDAVSLAPLIERLRALPERPEVRLEVPPSAPPEFTAASR